MLRALISLRGWVVFFCLAIATIISCWWLPAYGQDKSREQQLADLEKQIQALTKKVEELRKTPGTVPATVADGTIPSDWIKALTWRSIGPANMAGRITAISVFEADPTTYWIATASGGLLKTVNNGITFDHQFDHEATVSIGDVCVAPSDRNIVWLGTGEGNPRNSVSYGDGVYKSTDGGKTWKNMGLPKTFQIGRIRVHPKNPDIVYVGALGRLYGPNEERGLFKTTDGGKTWQKILYIDDKTGIIDLALHPTDPETFVVATWDRLRDEFDDFLGEPPPPDGIEAYDPIRKYSKTSGIFKTTDGGKTFHRLTQGLPTCALGRIGLDYSRKNPNNVFAIIDSEKIGTGLPPVDVELGVQIEPAAPGKAEGKAAPGGREAAPPPTHEEGGLKLTTVAPNSAAARAGLKAGDVLLSLDGKPTASSSALIDLLRPHKVGDKVKVAYQRGSEKKEVEVALSGRRPAGGGMRMLNPGFAAEDAEGGVLVTDIDEQGPAAKAGLKIDDLVTAIDGKPIERFFPTLGTIARTHKADDKITLSVVRGNQKQEIAVPLVMGGFERIRGRRPKGHTPRPNGGGLGSQRENVQDQQGPDGFQTGGVYQSTDGGETWTRVNSLNPRPMYFSEIRVDPTDEKILYVLGVSLYRSKDGGKTFHDEGNRGLHSDQHALWIDPKDGRHLIIGCDGGFYQTYDRAEHWDHLNYLALGQFYHVDVDPRPIYRALGGLQDNGSWCGPTRTLHATGPVNEEWLLIGGGDGFVCRVDPRDPELVYCESQGGRITRRHLKTGERATIRPLRVPGKAAYRFNWNTPFILSSHNPSIFYCGAQYVFRSVERGDHLRIISPEITRTKKGSATALAESPRNAEVLYAGTDDGALWITRDGGGKWTEISGNLGLPGPRWVASIEPSRAVDGRAYVVFDAHRSNDDEPYVYVTEDYGQTWKSLRGNLPSGSTRVCREDLHNSNLLYLGTEFGVWVSANRGTSWTKLNNNLPTVAAHELAQHPITGEMVAATHGRSLWILDVNPLRQMTADTLKANAHLYQPNTVVRWRVEQGRDGWFSESERKFVGQNPLPGAQIYYSLAQKPKTISLKVLDHTGKVISELNARSEPGLHRVAWNLTPGGRGRAGGRRGGPPAAATIGGRGPAGAAPAPPTRGRAAEERGEQEPAAEVPAFFGGGPQQIKPGLYKVVLTVDGKELTQWIRVEPDPAEATTIIATDGGDEP
jgi:photosystem II stability/assembly factor-like uncharacterized protein